MKKYLIPFAFLLGAIVTLSVLLYPIIADYINSGRQTRVVAHYVEAVAAMDDGSKRELLEAARKYNRDLLLRGDRFEPSEADTAEYLAMLNTGLDVIGILAIEKIDVSLPIYHGTDEGVLQVGIGHLEGTSLPVGGLGSHSFITGHRGLPSSKLLTNLDKMDNGDTFSLYILGETLTYQVDDIQVVEPDALGVFAIDAGMDYCTLVTCTPYGVNTHRLLVRGHRVENNASAWHEINFADATRVDKVIIVLLFMTPLLPVFILYTIVQCVKIHTRGKMIHEANPVRSFRHGLYPGTGHRRVKRGGFRALRPDGHDET